MHEFQFQADDQQIGSFMGIAERDFGFAADIVIPYENDELEQPQLGQFLIVRLSGNDYTLGRITRFTPAGMLATPEGEDYMTRMGRNKSEIPTELKKAKIKYRVNLKLLGAVKPADNGSGYEYAPSQRRLPHLGAPVYWPHKDLRIGICKHAAPGGAELGYFALGEFVYSGKAKHEDGYFVHCPPKLPVTFDVNNLVSKRTAVFARAGYGKSNLIKLLTSELYQNGAPPQTKKEKPAGILIFDADGEYFWPNEGRPGLCDVPHLSEHIVVYTGRNREDTYQQWRAGGVKLDLRKLSPGDVFGIALSDERQEQQNVLKLKSMQNDEWANLVNAVYGKKFREIADEQIGAALGFHGEQIKSAGLEINAARSNVYRVVKMLHDPKSTLIDNTLQSLREGKLVIVDISLLSAKGGEVVAALLMRKIFAHNQEQFTNTSGGVIPTIAVIEEAQSVLGGRQPETSPFVEWVKEGRKYELGAVLITQQPGSLAHELLSQTDNWFCFHLLSEGDTAILGKSNSHYSRDILSHIVAEPIKGNCYMWTSKQPFVLPLRVRSFEEEYGQYINKARGPKIPVQQAVQQKANEDIAKMAKLLAPKLRKMGAAGLKLESDGAGRKKIKSWSPFYHLVKAVAEETGDTCNPNDLKERLFRQLFPSAEIQTDPETYFSATAAEWEKILGK
ncbi:MAG: ATP-binding protein [Gammaproteobacteria bacterium]